MIPRCMHSRGLGSQIALPFQWLNIAIRLSSNSSSSASSSDSSDSDSDNEKKYQMKKHIEKKIDEPKSFTEKKIDEPKEKESDLDTLIRDMLNNAPSKRLNVALKPRAKKADKPLDQQPYVYQLKAAADKIAMKLGEKKRSIASQLLERVESRRPDMDMPTRRIKNKELNVTDKQGRKSETKAKPWAHEKSIIGDLVAKSKQKYPSKRTDGKTQTSLQIDRSAPKMHIFFPNIAECTSNAPELSTWKALQRKELDLLVTHSPQNVFQELIQWTEQGKIWKFPIDNEQGMEEEQSVHFSEHVFMERHLRDWCPKQGPVRHFMELVCVGLSKNPYLTVQEKLSHIAWYKEFFDEKKELLRELGAIEIASSDSVKEIET